jgi:hypothetical protein
MPWPKESDSEKNRMKLNTKKVINPRGRILPKRLIDRKGNAF